MSDVEDTIAAIASPPSGAVRGIVRLSGLNAVSTVARVFQAASGCPALEEVSRPTRLLGQVAIELAHHKRSIDAMLLLWPGNRSYTRQPIAEIHTYGARPILAAVLSSVCQAGARLANPGEFTLRAFLAGRIDLTQAEAVLGVIDATSQSQLDRALQQMAGGIGAPLRQVREEMIFLLAELEAGLDFVEEDIEFIDRQTLVDRLHEIVVTVGSIAERLSSRDEGEFAPTVLLVGPPNAGKSSLFNAIVRRYAARTHSHEGEATAQAIVNSQAGTTRDTLRAELEFDGTQMILVDTAGLSDLAKSTAGPIDEVDRLSQVQSAEERARGSIELRCYSCESERDIADFAFPSEERQSHQATLSVVTKCDLMPEMSWGQAEGVYLTSSATGYGIDELLQATQNALLSAEAAAAGDMVGSTSNRCRDCLRRCRESAEAAWQLAVADGGEELVAGELRLALDELGQVLGVIYTDDILDRIFSQFCIGK